MKIIRSENDKYISIHIHCDNDFSMSWESLQKIKDRYYPHLNFVEVYPKNKEVINNANERHLIHIRDWKCLMLGDLEIESDIKEEGDLSISSVSKYIEDYIAETPKGKKLMCDVNDSQLDQIIDLIGGYHNQIVNDVILPDNRNKLNAITHLISLADLGKPLPIELVKEAIESAKRSVNYVSNSQVYED